MLPRRSLLLAGAGTLAAGALTARYRRSPELAPAPLPAAPAPPPKPAPPTAFTAGERRTLEAAQDRLLPSAPGSPGARDVGATAFLERELATGDFRPQVLERVKRGAARLDALARQAGAAHFAALAEERRDQVLRTYQGEDEAGDWFETLLDFTLEAFLGDPAHGGNPGEVAWRYLDITPGFPRPGGAP